MKSTKRFISVFLVLMMLMISVAATVSVNASTGKLCDYYATNPNNKPVSERQSQLTAVSAIGRKIC